MSTILFFVALDGVKLDKIDPRLKSHAFVFRNSDSRRSFTRWDVETAQQLRYVGEKNQHDLYVQGVSARS